MKRKLISIIAILTMVFPFTLIVHAEEIREEDFSDIFSKEELQKSLEEAARQPVVPDKGSDQKAGTKATGSYPSRRGVILVTGDKFSGLIPTGHAAIVWDQDFVVESVSKGVTSGPNNWNKAKTTCYGVTTYNTTAIQDARAADWTVTQIGKPYNYNFLDKNMRKKFYCSQLVWAAYKNRLGLDLDTSSYGAAVHPIELVNTSKTIPFINNKR